VVRRCQAVVSIHLGGQLRHSGDRAQQGDSRVKRDEPASDLARQIGDRTVDVVDVVDDLPADDCVMISEVASR
jgi:hypothetical protein